MKKIKSIWSLIVCITFIFSVSACGNQGKPAENTEKESFNIGETASFNDLKITADRIEYPTEDSLFKPDDGNVYLGVHFTIENISDKDIAISSMLLFTAYLDNIKTSLSITASAAFSEGTIDGTVAPGKKLSGYYAVEASEAWEKLEIHFAADLLTSTKNKAIFTFLSSDISSAKPSDPNNEQQSSPNEEQEPPANNNLDTNTPDKPTNNKEPSIDNSKPNETDTQVSATTGQINALKKAKSYLNVSAFSREGLIKQLEFEKFSNEDAVYAVDNCGADWNEQALKKAKSYLSISAFSYTGILKQLEFEKFTSEQATYGADNCGADWNEQAEKKAKSYLDLTAFSYDGLISQLEFEGFTPEQAEYGAKANGY